VKHLLILLSFLFLSSPVIGDNHKGETLYGWGKCCDYKWMGFGEKDTHPKYQGQVKDGKPNGLGSLTYPDGSKYVGEYKDGKRHGQGTSTWSDGRKYVGEYKDGIPNGQGTHTFGKGDFEGDKYEGDTRVVSQMVKEHTLVLMEKSTKENGRMRNLGTENITTKTETS
jgi:hypothetical protein